MNMIPQKIKIGYFLEIRMVAINNVIFEIPLTALFKFVPLCSRQISGLKETGFLRKTRFLNVYKRDEFAKWCTTDFQIINFTRPERGDNTHSISPTDNAVNLFMWKSVTDCTVSLYSHLN